MNVGVFLRAPVATLDAIRGRTLRAVASVTPLAPELLRDRDRRIFAYALVAVGLAFGLTLVAPMALLAIGPIVLGVPHLAADIRYLVARPGLHRRVGFWAFVALPVVVSFLVPHAWIAMLAIAGGALVARVGLVRRLALALGGLALAAICFHFGRLADVALAHAHNAIAVAFFCLWSRGEGRPVRHLVVVAVFLLGLGAIALGVLDGGAASRLGSSALYDSERLVSSLSPFEDPVVSVRVVLAFAFAQSVHYAVWVRLVPEEDRPRRGLRSFASSLRALRDDLGGVLLLLIVGVMLGLAGWACFALAAARDGYLRLAIFHGPLELGAAAILLLERGRIGEKRGKDDGLASKNQRVCRSARGTAS
jgi:hypothetical protein